MSESQTEQGQVSWKHWLFSQNSPCHRCVTLISHAEEELGWAVLSSGFI